MYELMEKFLKFALSCLYWFAGIFAVFAIPNFIFPLCWLLSGETLEKGRYMDDEFSRFIVDSCLDFNDVAALNNNMEQLLGLLNKEISLIDIDSGKSLKELNKEVLLLALFRMNRRYFYPVEGEFAKRFSLTCGDFKAQIALVKRDSVVVISDSNFGFLRDGTYVSSELCNLLNME